MNVPSYEALLSKEKMIKVVQELCEKMNQVENAGYVTQDDIIQGDVIVVANQEMPAEWLNAKDMDELINYINADENAIKGTSYLSTMRLSDLPANMIQAEVKAEVLLTSDIGKVILFTITSNDTSPYHWEYTSAWGSPGVWRSFQPL